MKSRILALFFVLSIFNAKAQLSAPDTLQTIMGPLTIQPIQHASLVLTVHGVTIYSDPSGGADYFKGIAAPGIILITDIHGDHFDSKTLEAAGRPPATGARSAAGSRRQIARRRQG